MQSRTQGRAGFRAQTKGFTLIELLVVIAIIGILASVVLVSLSSAREKAKITNFKQVVKSVQTKALEVCQDTTPIPYTDSTVFGSFPGGEVDPAQITSGATPDNCGPDSDGTFSATIPSTSGYLTATCTATIDNTGITGFTGC